MRELPLLDDKGNFAHFSFPGGYSITYLTRDEGTICSTCAEKWIKNSDNYEEDGSIAGFNCGSEPTLGYVIWEGEDEQCEECSEPLHSEYGEPPK